jgi:hypothetical protein
MKLLEIGFLWGDLLLSWLKGVLEDSERTFIYELKNHGGESKQLSMDLSLFGQNKLKQNPTIL